MLHLHALDDGEHVAARDQVACFHPEVDDAARKGRGRMRVGVLDAAIEGPGRDQRDLVRLRADDLQLRAMADQLDSRGPEPASTL